MASYDQDSLFRFINAAIAGKPAAPEDALAAAHALLDVFSGKDLKKEMGIKRKPGQRGAAVKMSSVTIDSPLFGVAQGYVAKRYKYQEAIEAIAELTGKDERTAKEYLKALKPRAERAHKLCLWMESVAVPSEKS